ncbi:class I SAM-dependent methyltransferase, partial [Dehalococcoidia bacterium]|nr:class I SAM-dependent methyltransferase [Dehalococcoidia bacterium]
YIGYLIHQWIGTMFFIRFIEWKALFDYLQPKQGEKVLDVACGSGILTFKIAEKGCHAYGIDISSDAINSAQYLAEREKISCEFKVSDAESLSFPDGYFDKVVCSSSLEHFQDDLNALKEMNRVLKTNGILVLTVDSFTYPISSELKEKHAEKGFVMNYYDKTKLKGKLERAGFELDQSKYLLNSPITAFLYNLWIKLWIKNIGGYGLLWPMISFIGIPLGLVSDRLLGKKDAGYTLIAKARKP